VLVLARQPAPEHELPAGLEALFAPLQEAARSGDLAALKQALETLRPALLEAAPDQAEAIDALLAKLRDRFPTP